MARLGELTTQDRNDPAAFWKRVSGDSTYNDQQRQYATDQYTAESQWGAGNERRGLTLRNVDQFNSYDAPPLSTQPEPGGQPGTDPSQPATTETALANDANPNKTTTTQGTQQLLNDTLINMLGQNPSNVSMSDPVLAKQGESFRFARERQRAAEQQAMAERMGAQNMGESGAFDAAVQQGHQQAGEDQASFEAQLVGREMERRRDEIMKALALGGEMIDADLRRQLQDELGKLQIALGNREADIRSSLGWGDINLRDKLGSLGALIDLLGLKQGDAHFYDNLGFQIGSKEADLNRDALLSLF